MILNIAGIPIEVFKKDIKNMHLSVKPPNGSVTVSAPLTMNDLTIERFVRTKIGWIKKQIEKFDNQLRQSEREHVSGETMYVWGKQYYLKMTYGGKNSLMLSADKALLTVRKDSTPEKREAFIREWYRDLLKEEIIKKLAKWEEITDLHPNGWQTKYMTTRWGTCNTKTGKIWLNLQLAQKTPECLEYVILHELVHLVGKKHNDRFVFLMDKHMPMWREIKVKLNGQTLDYWE